MQQGGRLRFVAPEILKGIQRVNEASDVYSLAMTIYALGTGKRPFHDIFADYAASRAAEDGKRPSRTYLPVPDDSLSDTPPDSPTDSEWDPDVFRTSQVNPSGDILATTCFGGLTYAESEQLWVWLTQMWDHTPSSRPSMLAIQSATSLHLPVTGHLPTSKTAVSEAYTQVLALLEMVIRQTQFPEHLDTVAQAFLGGAGFSDPRIVDGSLPLGVDHPLWHLLDNMWALRLDTQNRLSIDLVLNRSEEIVLDV